MNVTSRKTLLAIDPPGRELDWNNENDLRHIEIEAYADYDKHPKPTMAPPERSRWWWFWRFFGMFVYMPGRKYLRRYLNHRYVRKDWHSSGRDEYDWPFAERIQKWIDRGPSKGRRAFWLRSVLAWLTDTNVYDQCSWCGNTAFHSEVEIFDGPDDTEGREINMFEWVEGGGVDYWGEGQDAYGWKWCYRCGANEWDTG